MTSIRTYTIIFGALMAISTIQALFEFSGFLAQEYWIGLAIILILSSLKAMAVAGWYMHLRDEPRAVTYLALAGVIGVVALTAGAGYSIL